jgi:error-prone DNA polymerase
MLARIGALNHISAETPLHRRDALWQVEKAGRRVKPLLEGVIEQDTRSPLAQMDIEERLVSDYYGTGLTAGPHPMAYKRHELQSMGIKSAFELRETANGKKATIAGSVITRQRPGTAKGLIFMTLEDETGHANVIVMPDFYERNRRAVVSEKFVRIYGTVQNQDGIVHLRAEKITPLQISAAQVSSHDFH